MQEIGEFIILNSNEDVPLNEKNKIIWRKISAVKDAYRIRDYTLVSGENYRETIFFENNFKIKFSLDAYFDARFAAERKEISQWYSGKSLFIAGGGIGIYSIYLASKFNFILNSEINPVCKNLFIENMALNKIVNSSFTNVFSEKITNDKKMILKFSHMLIVMPLFEELTKRLIFRAKKNNPQIKIMCYIKNLEIVHFLTAYNFDFSYEAVKRYSKEEKIYRITIE